VAKTALPGLAFSPVRVIGWSGGAVGSEPTIEVMVLFRFDPSELNRQGLASGLTVAELARLLGRSHAS
jgi:hypothetical protein